MLVVMNQSSYFFVISPNNFQNWFIVDK